MAVSAAFTTGTTDNIETYTVQEDINSLDPNDLSGGVGQITVNRDVKGNVKQLLATDMSLMDTTVGVVAGRIRDLTVNESGLSVTADSRLVLLNAWRSVPPYLGTLQNAMTYYFSLVSLPAPAVHASIASRSVSFPGWEGNLWEYLKQMFAAEQIEIAVTSDAGFVVRPTRQYTYDLDRELDASYSLNQQTTAEVVRVHYYGNLYRNDGQVFPVPLSPPLPGEDLPADTSESVYSVGAAETMVVDINLSASLDSVNQPTCVAFVNDKDYSGTGGFYSVVGNDDLPVMPAQWAAEGGRLKVELTSKPDVIRLTIVGANIPGLAPFRIAMSSGGSNYYNSLHITGDGVFQTDQVIDIVTGAGASVTGEKIGAEVTNPFINTLSKALFVGARTAGAYALEHTISGRVSSLVDSADVSPAFGYMAGGMISRDNSKFRITSVTITPEAVQYNATQDVIASDFNSLGLTTAQFNAIWDGVRALDFSMDPLRRS